MLSYINAKTASLRYINAKTVNVKLHNIYFKRRVKFATKKNTWKQSNKTQK